MTLRTFSYVLQSLSLAPAMAMASPSPSWYLGPHADDATAEAYGDLRLPTGSVDGLVYLHSGTSKMRARIGGVWVVYDLDAQAAATAAAASAAAALVSEGLAEADKVQTGLDRVQTGLDRVATGADVVTTAAARDAALAALDSFDDRYLGAKASDPTLDNDGNALITGALYWNTPLAKMRTWSGAIWTDSIPGSYLATTGGTMTGQLLGAVGTAGAPGFSFAADANTGMWSPSGDVIAWSTGGSERMRLNSTGLGIGTTAPLAPLDVIGPAGVYITTASSGGSPLGGQIYLGDSAFRNASYFNSAPGIGAVYGSYGNASDLAFYTYNGAANSRLEVMRLVGGRLLVGQTTSTGLATSSVSAAGVLATSGFLTGHQTSMGVFQHSADITSIRSYGALAGSGVLAFNTGGGGGSADSEKMRLDSSGKLGIGTTTPNSYAYNSNAQLVVAGTTHASIGVVTNSASTGAVAFARGTTGSDRYRGMLQYDQAADAMTLWTSGAERMRIDASGNVLIGTTSNTTGARLDVVGGIVNAGFGLSVQGGGNPTAGAGLELAYTGGISYINSYSRTGSVYLPLTLRASYHAFDIAGTEIVRIAATGYVGIGTTTPSAKLNIVGPLSSQLVLQHVATDAAIKWGTVATAHYTNAQQATTIALGESNATENIVNVGGGASAQNASTMIRFWTAASNTTLLGSEKMRLDTSGNLLIGTTTAVEKLTVQGQIHYSGPILSCAHGSMSLRSTHAAGGSMYFDAAFGGATHGTFSFRSSSGATQRLLIDASGNTLIGLGSPAYRLHVNGNFGIAPGVGTTVTPANNADLVIETTSNTTLTFKLKGSDGVVRTGTVTLA